MLLGCCSRLPLLAAADVASEVEIREWPVPWADSRPRHKIWFGTDANTVGRAKLP